MSTLYFCFICDKSWYTFSHINNSIWPYQCHLSFPILFILLISWLIHWSTELLSLEFLIILPWENRGFYISILTHFMRNCCFNMNILKLKFAFHQIQEHKCRLIYFTTFTKIFSALFKAKSPRQVHDIEGQL